MAFAPVPRDGEISWHDPGSHSAADAWDARTVVVTGFGVSGYAAADQLMQRGAHVIVLDSRDDDRNREQAEVLEVLGVDVRLGADAVASLPRDVEPDVVVTSPGWRPDHPVLAEAGARGVEVWGEVELAWRMRPAGSAPWLAITGTNGKTTTVQMLESILLADGRRAIAAGNVGVPIVEAVLDPHPYEVIAVELSSFQLHWSSSLAPQAGACLNLAPDHLDWHGSFAAYAEAKGRVYRNNEVACIYNSADPGTEALVRAADVIEGARAVGFTLSTPAIGEVGLVDDILCDRAFVAERRDSAAELATLADLDHLGPRAPHTVANALAAAALARAHGVPASAVRSGLRAYRPGAHRITRIAQRADVVWVDDSKATNAHAAGASLRAFERVVWIAGGLAKGADFDELVAAHGSRFRGVVVIGQDQDAVLGALGRHAPEVPVVVVPKREDGGVTTADGRRIMRAAVTAAKHLSRPGDAVLMAPACASMDQFVSYAERGEAFAAAVAELVTADSTDGRSGDQR